VSFGGGLGRVDDLKFSRHVILNVMGTAQPVDSPIRLVTVPGITNMGEAPASTKEQV